MVVDITSKRPQYENLFVFILRKAVLKAVWTSVINHREIEKKYRIYSILYPVYFNYVFLLFSFLNYFPIEKIRGKILLSILFIKFFSNLNGKSG